MGLESFEQVVFLSSRGLYKGSDVRMTVVMDTLLGTMIDGQGDETLIGRYGAQWFELSAGGNDTVVSGVGDGFGDVISVDSLGAGSVYSGNDRVIGFDGADQVRVGSTVLGVTYEEGRTVFQIDQGTLSVDAILQQVAPDVWMI